MTDYERKKQQRFRDWLKCSMGFVKSEKEKFLAPLENWSEPSWVFQLPEFEIFVSSTRTHGGNLLWLSAPMGFGKSVLAAYLSNTLAEQYPSSLVTFYFCNGKRSLEEGINVIRTFLYQVTKSSSNAMASIFRHWADEDEFSNIRRVAIDANYQLREIVTEAIQIILSEDCKMVFFVVDGLNECPEPSLSEIIEFLKFLCNVSPFIRIIVICQKTAKLTAKLSDLSIVKELREEDNAGTIAEFVRHKLEKNPSLQTSFRAYFHEEPIEFFATRHKGMFLWVNMVFTLLDGVYSKNEFKKILNSSGPTIAPLYQQVLTRLQSELSEIDETWIIEVLTWLVITRRDLQMTEVKDGISLTRGLRIPHAESDTVMNIDPLLSRCGSFVRISKDSESGNDILSLHHSFKQFVTDKKRHKCWFFIDENIAHVIVASACISYLSSEMNQHHHDIHDAEQARATLESDSSLFNYATVHLSVHLNEITSASLPKYGLQKGLKRLFEKDRFLSWVRNVILFCEQSVYKPNNSFLVAFTDTVLQIQNWLRREGLEEVIVSHCWRHIRRDKTRSFRFPLTSVMKAAWHTYGSSSSQRRHVGFMQWAIEVATEVLLTEVSLIASANLRFRALAASFIVDRLNAASDMHQSPKALEGISEENATACANMGHIYAMKLRDIHSLRSAIVWYRKSLHYAEEGYIYGCMSRTYGDIYIAGRQLVDINESVQYGREATRLSEVNKGNDFAECLNTLGIALGRRYILSKDEQDIEESIRVSRQAVDITADENPRKSLYINSFISTMLLKLQNVPSTSYHDELVFVITLGRKGIKLSTNPVWKAMCMDVVAEALLLQYEETDPQMPLDESDIDEAIELRRGALLLIPDEPVLVNNLAFTLVRRAEDWRFDQREKDLKEVMELAERLEAGTLKVFIESREMMWRHDALSSI